MRALIRFAHAPRAAKAPTDFVRLLARVELVPFPVTREPAFFLALYGVGLESAPFQSSQTLHTSSRDLGALGLDVDRVQRLAGGHE